MITAAPPSIVWIMASLGCNCAKHLQRLSPCAKENVDVFLMGELMHRRGRGTLAAPEYWQVTTVAF